LGRRVAPHEVLLDAPPMKLEVQFNVDVHFARENTWRPLGDVSPVVRTLAERQFDDYVKRVRVFVAPALAEETKRVSDVATLLQSAISQTDAP
jgi:hypothetical protein